MTWTLCRWLEVRNQAVTANWYNSRVRFRRVVFLFAKHSSGDNLPFVLSLLAGLFLVWFLSPSPSYPLAPFEFWVSLSIIMISECSSTFLWCSLICFTWNLPSPPFLDRWWFRGLWVRTLPGLALPVFTTPWSPASPPPLYLQREKSRWVCTLETCSRYFYFYFWQVALGLHITHWKPVEGVFV